MSTEKAPGAPDGTILDTAKFHYTDPTRTRTDFVSDPHGPNGVSPQKSPCGSGRVRVVEFSS